GAMTMAIACPGVMVTASRPIDTVGSPSPITPLTNPASRNAAPMRMRSDSCMRGTLTDRANGHNLDLTENAFGHTEGRSGKIHAFRSGRLAAVRCDCGDPEHHRRGRPRAPGTCLRQRADQGP